MAIFIVGIGVWLSGGSWLFFHYFLVKNGPFGPQPNPLEPWWLTLHAAFAFAAIWLFGLLWGVHVATAWPLSRRRSSGVFLAGILGCLIVSGYLLYYAGDELTRSVLSVLHWGIGLACPVFYFLHRLQSPKRRMTHIKGDRVGRLQKLASITRMFLLAALLLALHPLSAQADENLLNYVKGAEVQPKNTWELYQWITRRSDKGTGHYTAWDFQTELEYGVTDRLAVALYLNGQAIDTKGILVDAYIPKDMNYGYAFSGVAAAFKYNFLSPFKDGIGISLYAEPIIATKDPHSGQDKRMYSFESSLLLQKNFLDDTLVWLTNIGLESTYARRAAVENLPPDFEWPVVPEMEIEPTLSVGFSKRFASNWYGGAEAQYQSEFETEVGRERWSLFAGPTLHYGARKWWATLTWFPQLRGGGEQVPGQNNPNLQLVEKTKQEWRLKIGFNF